MRHTRQKLLEAIESACSTRAERGFFSTRQAAEDVVAFLRLEGEESWSQLREELAFHVIERTIEHAMRRAISRVDPKQRRLDLPGYANVPEFIRIGNDWADLWHVTFEQYRQSNDELEARIKSYKYTRRDPEKLKRDERQLRDRRKLENNIAAYSTDPAMTVGPAMEQYTALTARQRRAAEVRWRARTRNQ